MHLLYYNLQPHDQHGKQRHGHNCRQSRNTASSGCCRSCISSTGHHEIQTLVIANIGCYNSKHVCNIINNNMNITIKFHYQQHHDKHEQQHWYSKNPKPTIFKLQLQRKTRPSIEPRQCSQREIVRWRSRNTPTRFFQVPWIGGELEGVEDTFGWEERNAGDVVGVLNCGVDREIAGGLV